jgi:hypothetical protein
MRRGRRWARCVSSARVAVAGGAVTAAALIAVGACAAGESWTKPVPTLASSPYSAAAFDQIRTAWGDPEHTDPAKLRQLLERFIERFPDDGLVLLARIYLALVAMQQKDFDAADRQLEACKELPQGTTRDLWTVARARRLRWRGEPEAALELLRPLVGNYVDPATHALFQEELTLSALASHREYEAISYMDAWLRASSEEDERRTRATVTALVARLPRDVLVGALEAMRRQRANLGYGVAIERILAGRLATIATESGDAELARMLLDPSAGAIVITGEAGVELGELATSPRGLNVVEGRAIGLLLPTESPGLRDESADVLRGVMWALGLPRGLRGAPTRPSSAVAEAGAPSTRAPRGLRATTCAPPELAQALEDPLPSESLHLMTRDDAGSVDRTEVSLDELAGEGAALIIAGLDPQTAARALRWGENHRVAVILLVPPADRLSAGAFGFVLGESRASVVDALARGAPSLAKERVAPVIDTSEVALYPPQGGRVGPLTVLPPVACDIPPTRAGDPRFPIPEWEHDKTRAWLVSGSPGCARDVMGELSAARLRGIVALTLEAAALPAQAPGLRVISASAGAVPGGASIDARDGELDRFGATLGDLSWWTALGRDAATLARVAVDQLPTDTVTDPRAVTDRRAQARDKLASARARLWSTEGVAWTSGHTMKRTVCTIDAPVR